MRNRLSRRASGAAIYDRDGNALAVSIEGTSIAAYLNQIEDKKSSIPGTCRHTPERRTQTAEAISGQAGIYLGKTSGHSQ